MLRCALTSRLVAALAAAIGVTIEAPALAFDIGGDGVQSELDSCVRKRSTFIVGFDPEVMLEVPLGRDDGDDVAHGPEETSAPASCQPD